MSKEKSCNVFQKLVATLFILAINFFIIGQLFGNWVNDPFMSQRLSDHNNTALLDFAESLQLTFFIGFYPLVAFLFTLLIPDFINWDWVFVLGGLCWSIGVGSFNHATNIDGAIGLISTLSGIGGSILFFKSMEYFDFIFKDVSPNLDYIDSRCNTFFKEILDYGKVLLALSSAGGVFVNVWVVSNEYNNKDMMDKISIGISTSVAGSSLIVALLMDMNRKSKKTEYQQLQSTKTKIQFNPETFDEITWTESLNFSAFFVAQLTLGFLFFVPTVDFHPFLQTHFNQTITTYTQNEIVTTLFVGFFGAPIISIVVGFIAMLILKCVDRSNQSNQEFNYISLKYLVGNLFLLTGFILWHYSYADDLIFTEQMKNQVFSSAFFMGSGVGIAFNAVFNLPGSFYFKYRKYDPAIKWKYLLFLALTPGITSSQWVLNAIKQENIEFGVYLMAMQGSVCFLATAIWVNDVVKWFVASQTFDRKTRTS